MATSEVARLALEFQHTQAEHSFQQIDSPAHGTEAAQTHTKQTAALTLQPVSSPEAASPTPEKHKREKREGREGGLVVEARLASN